MAGSSIGLSTMYATACCSLRGARMHSLGSWMLSACARRGCHRGWFRICNHGAPSIFLDAHSSLLVFTAGFEVTAKNALYELCRNYATEYLRATFMRQVFELEQKVYESEGVPIDLLLAPTDNTACCDLLATKTNKFTGILPLLDELAREDASDKKFVAALNASFGTEQGAYFKAKDKVAKQASKFYYGSKQEGCDFWVTHFAGAVRQVPRFLVV